MKTTLDKTPPSVEAVSADKKVRRDFMKFDFSGLDSIERIKHRLGRLKLIEKVEDEAGNIFAAEQALNSVETFLAALNNILNGNVSADKLDMEVLTLGSKFTAIPGQLGLREALLKALRSENIDNPSWLKVEQELQKFLGKQAIEMK